MLDYNGDGRQDLLVANTTTGKWNILKSTGASLVVSDESFSGKARAHRQRAPAREVEGTTVPVPGGSGVHAELDS